MVSMAKQVKEEGGLDRLSSLPDHILDHILSFLPTKETVSTSILSTRWRYLFASSISILDFNECLQFVNDGAKDNFRSFVDRLLFESKQVNLEIFRLCDLSQFDDPIRLYDWIAATICRGVKEIDICSASQIMLPITLFTCLSLTTLKLTGGGEIKFPTKACLPNLKTLHLDALVCSDGSILSLVSSCLVLDDLAFVDCVFRKISVLSIHNLSLKRLVLDFEDRKFSLSWNFYYTVEINAPCLVYFRYAGLLAEASSFSNMNSLETADVRIFNCPDPTVYNVDRRPCATHLLQAICNVQSLVLYIEEADMIFPRRSKPLLSFHNLVELNVLNYRGSWQETWLVEFLHTMPNLETLLLSRYIRGGLTLRSWSAPEAAPCCFIHLKKVEIQEYEGDSATFNMMSYFLNHALLLKTFIIRTNPWQGDRSQSTIIKKLQSLQKYSKECEVKIN